MNTPVGQLHKLKRPWFRIDNDYGNILDLVDRMQRSIMHADIKEVVDSLEVVGNLLMGIEVRWRELHGDYRLSNKEDFNRKMGDTSAPINTFKAKQNAKEMTTDREVKLLAMIDDQAKYIWAMALDICHTSFENHPLDFDSSYLLLSNVERRMTNTDWMMQEYWFQRGLESEVRVFVYG